VVIARIRHMRCASELRKEWRYNNEHYIVLAHIILTLTGIPYADWVRKHIFEPIGMDSATNDSHDAARTGRRTDGFVRSGLDRRQKGSMGIARGIGWWTESDGMWCLGPGGIAMSAKDGVSLDSFFLERRG